jgi:hypothetical protein
MWVRGQTNVPAALPLAKGDPAHFEYEAGCAPDCDVDGLYKILHTFLAPTGNRTTNL